MRAAVQVDADHLGARPDRQVGLELGRTLDRLAERLGEGCQRIDRERDLRLAAKRGRIERALRREVEVVGAHGETLDLYCPCAIDRRRQPAVPDHVLRPQPRLGRQPQPLGAPFERDLHLRPPLTQVPQRGEVERRSHLPGAHLAGHEIGGRDRDAALGLHQGTIHVRGQLERSGERRRHQVTQRGQLAKCKTDARVQALVGQIDPAGPGQRRRLGRRAQLLDRQLVRSGPCRGQRQLHTLPEQTGSRGG